MKLTPNQISKNMKITAIELSEMISSEEFYKQFDHCPRCGKISDGPLTESRDDREYEYNMINHRRCRDCLIKWEYTEYQNIQHDPAYQEFMRIRNNPPPRPTIQFENELGKPNPVKHRWVDKGPPPPPPPSGFEPRKVTEAGCLFWIIGGITTIVTGIGVLL